MKYEQLSPKQHENYKNTHTQNTTTSTRQTYILIDIYMNIYESAPICGSTAFFWPK